MATIKRPLRAGLGLALALITAASCGQDGEQGVAAGSKTEQPGKVKPGPWDRAFLSVSVTRDGQPRPLVEGTRIRLDFRSASGDSPDSLGANAGCNSMGGPAEIEDGHLVVGDLATTEMGCDPPRMEQDQWLAGFLTSKPALVLEGDDLTLTSEGTEIKLQDRETADPDRPLKGTHWVVDGIMDGDSVSSVPGDAVAFIKIGEDGSFGGNTGCNSMGGKAAEAETRGDTPHTPGTGTVNFSEVVTTKIACGGDQDSLERAVLAVLDGDVDYEIEADALRLNHPSGKGLMLRAEEE